MNKQKLIFSVLTFKEMFLPHLMLGFNESSFRKFIISVAQTWML